MPVRSTSGVQLAGSATLRAVEPCPGFIEDRFGGLESSMHTLYASITGGGSEYHTNQQHVHF